MQAKKGTKKPAVVTAAEPKAAKVEPVETKKAPEKTASEAVKKTTAKKAELKTEIYLQFDGKEYTEKEIFKKVKDAWTKEWKRKVGDLKEVKIYLKPEEASAYYVINGEVTGQVAL